MNDTTRRRFLKGAALSTGGLTISALASETHAQSKTDSTKIRWDETYDIIVVGSGLAATVAATYAAKNKARVLMIEKMAVFGGTSAISNATFAVAGSDLQAKQNIKDDWKSFFDDMEARSNGINNPELHEVIARRSPDAYNFIKSEGAKFEDTLSTVGGQSVPRVVSPVSNGEVGIMGPLRKNFVEKYGGTAMTRCRADEIIFDDKGRAVGLQVRTNYRFDPALYSDDLENKGGTVRNFGATKAIICGTGGFANDKIMRKNEFPKYKDLVSTQQIGATMSGYKLLSEAGGTMVHTSLVQHSLPLGAILSAKGFMIDPNSGKRFVDELGGGSAIRYNVNVPDLVAKFIKTSGGKYPLAIFDTRTAATYEDQAQFFRNVRIGYVIEADSIEALAKKIAIDATTLRETTNRYNQQVRNGKDEDFNKDLLSLKALTVEQPPFYAYYVYPHVNYCLGGALINKDAQVVRRFTDNVPIPGLYAAGEATGGVHGAGRISGTSIADCCVFGMVAAENALKQG
jgi:fumarate reductase flavoprotein subunit